MTIRISAKPSYYICDGNQRHTSITQSQAPAERRLVEAWVTPYREFLRRGRKESPHSLRRPLSPHASAEEETGRDSVKIMIVMKQRKTQRGDVRGYPKKNLSVICRLLRIPCYHQHQRRHREAEKGWRAYRYWYRSMTLRASLSAGNEVVPFCYPGGKHLLL
jgi:hypothetical protein